MPPKATARRRYTRTLPVVGLVALVFGVALSWYVVDRTKGGLAGVVKHIENVWHGKEQLDGDKTPGEFLRYAKRRLEGHTRVEPLVLPILDIVQRQIERPVPAIEFSPLSRIAQEQSSLPGGGAIVKLLVSTPDEVRNALANASPGQIIELQPGHYRFKQNLLIGKPGTPERPIVLRGGVPGQVFIEFDTVEGFHVTQSDWIFENLSIKGICKDHNDCEHAFHVVGNAKRTIIRNNRIEDFNAPIKVNGFGSDWPDDGLIQFNVITNNYPRVTTLPVTFVDLVGANRWGVADNVLSNFVKGDGDGVSYGIFMKGAGREGRIERNLVICTLGNISQPGVRVGVSFGGGGTEPNFCRDRACKAEHLAGLASNNIIAHCNDFGIDVFRSVSTTIAHNTLINSAGIDVRAAPSTAKIYGNLLEGRVRARNGGQVKTDMNEIGSDFLSKALQDPDKLDLRWRNVPDKIPSLPSVPTDFCGRVRPDGTLPGALGPDGPCATLPGVK